MSGVRGARYWLGDMQDCAEGEHGEFWQDEFARTLDAHIAGHNNGTWQEWRDLRLASVCGAGEVASGCAHDWTPESDTYVCVICGDERHPQQVAERGALDEVDDRGTDPAFIASLEERFGKFDLDVAAAKHNHKARRYYTRADDGLTQQWYGRVWCNPPYSDCGAWVRKAWSEWPGGGLSSAMRVAMGDSPSLIVMLLPANRVEQGWWQDHVEPFRDRTGSPLKVEFLRGRMRFDQPSAVIGPKGDRPPFGCALLIWGDRS